MASTSPSAPVVPQTQGDDTVSPWLINLKRLAAMLGVSEATAYRMRAAGKLPSPVLLAKNTVRWRVDEVRAWLDAGAPPLAQWSARRR